MDATSKRIVNYLDSSDIELRLSSLRVLSELGALKGPALKAIDKILAEEDVSLNRKILGVLSLKPNRELMDYYIPFLKDEDGVKEKALQALETLGPAASQTIQKQYKSTTDGLLKRSFITLLARVPNRSNYEFLSKAILGEGFELQKHVCYEVRNNSGKYADKDKKLFESVIRENIRIADKNKNSQALTSFVILLGYLGLKTSLNVVMRFTDMRRPIELRRHALISLFKLPLTGKIDETAQKNLLLYLAEPDYSNIVQNALNILEPIQATKKFEKTYVELMTSNPHNAVKNFALGKLAQLNSKVALERLTSQLIGGDTFLYEKAQRVLEQSEQGINYLIKRLDNIATPEAAERVGGLLAMDRSRIKPKQVTDMWNKVEKHILEPGIKARIYFALVRKINPDMAYEKTLKRAAFYKTKKAYEKARTLLNLLSGTLLFNQEAKFEMSVITLKLSKKDVSSTYRSQDPAIPMFQSMIPQKNFGLFNRIKKEKVITPEDIFYLGFHFSEKLFDQKDFGTQLLKHLLTKYSRSPYAKKARKKLETVGGSAYVPSISKGRRH